MSDNLDAILKSLSAGDKQKNEALIKSFLSTPNGKQVSDALDKMSADDLARLIDSAPKGPLQNIISDPQKLQSILSDPNAMKKIKRKLK